MGRVDDDEVMDVYGRVLREAAREEVGNDPQLETVHDDSPHDSLGDQPTGESPEAFDEASWEEFWK